MSDRIVKIAILLPLLAMFNVAVFAQETNSFTADRPGSTTGPDVLPKGRFQWETGFGYEYSKNDGERKDNFTINTSLFRFGVTDNVEVRFGIDGMYTKEQDRKYGGVANVSIGTKIALFEGRKAIPAISLLGNVYIPGCKDSNYLPQNVGGSMNLLFKNEICSWFSLGYQVGLSWKDNAKPTTFAGVSFGFAPTDKLGLFIEQYNNFHDEISCMSEIGASYMVHPRVQIDLATDIDLRHFGNFHNVMVGVAWQIYK